MLRLPYLVSLLLVAGLSAAYLGGPYVSPHPHVAHLALAPTYTPAPAIAELGAQMTPLGQRLFYSTHPVLTPDVAAFCHFDLSPGAIIEGCYNGDGTLYINPDYPLYREVAIHEMLHVAYGKLDILERAKVDAAGAAYLASCADCWEITFKLDHYAQDDFTQANERHSYLAEHRGHLPALLEAHYRRYIHY